MAEKQEKILDIKVNYEKAIKAIAEYKKQIEAVKTEEKELNKLLKEGDISKEEYADKMTLAKAKIADYNDSIRITTKYLRNQIKQEQLQAGSLKSLRAQLSNLTAAYDALSEADRKAAEGEKLKNKINEVTDALKEAEEETQRYYRNVGNYEEAIKSALGLNSDFANSIMELAQSKNGVSGFFNEVIGKVKAFSISLLGLLKNPAFGALAGIVGIGMAFRWFYDYNKGIKEATKLTKQFTDLSGAKLKEYRSEVQALADYYGKDFADTLRATNTLSKQFGINTSEALKIIKDGFIAGADAKNEFFDGIKEYSAQFKEAGLSASEFVAIIAQTNEMGIFSDKGIDVIKEANVRLREMTQATADALDGIGISSKQVQEDLKKGTKTIFDVVKEISARLGELPDSASAVGTAIADIFGEMGEDAGLKYIRALKDISIQLDDVKKKTGELGKIEEDMVASQTELSKEIALLFDATGGSFEKMSAKIKLFVNDVLTALIKETRTLFESVEAISQRDMDMAKRLGIDTATAEIEKEYTKIKGIQDRYVEEGLSQEEALKKAKEERLEALKRLLKQEEIYLQEAASTNKKYNEELKNASFWRQGVGLDRTNADINADIAASWDKYMSQIAYVESLKEKIKLISSSSSSATEEKGKNNLLEDSKEAKQTELEAVRSAEDAMLALVKDKREQARKEIELNYSRQIEDLQIRLKQEENLTAKAREALNTQIVALERQKAIELQKLSDEELQKEIEDRTKLISLQLEAVKEGSEQEYSLRMQQLISQRDAELANKELTEQMKLAIVGKYNKQMDDLNLQHEQDISAKQQETIRMRMENELMHLQQSGASELEILQAQAEQKLELMNSIQQQEEESEEAYLNRKLQAQQEYLDAKQAISEKEIEIEQTKANAMSQITGAMASLLEQAGENNRSAAIAAKTLAIAEVAISQGVAIANAVKAATAGSKSIWEVVASIATAITTVVSTMATATKSIKSAKFATGGLVTGPGTGTSDSVPAQLSNGESVITARATEMFAPILSSFNMMGGGVPINVAQSSSQSIGEDMLARAVAKGMLMAPAPQVSVEEFTSVANKVKFLESNGSL